MSNQEILDLLESIIESIRLVEERFLNIKAPNDFVTSSEGVTLLDAIAMRLQVIGESVKKIQKINSTFLESFPDIEWNKISRFRDLVSHHYENIDYEIVYDICESHLSKLKIAINAILIKHKNSFI